MSRTGRLTMAGAGLAAAASVVAWGRVPASPTADTGRSALDGAALFQAKGCGACHSGPDSVSSFSGVYPDLTAAASWAGDRRPGLDAASYLAESIREPSAFLAPGAIGNGVGTTSGMPILELSEAEIDAVVDHLLDDEEDPGE